MRVRESTNRISRVMLLAFMLTATWSFGNYDPRLELSYATEVPATLNQKTQSDGTKDWLSFLSSTRALVVRVPAAKYPQQATPTAGQVAALPRARAQLEAAADSDPASGPGYKHSLYSSLAVRLPAQRGPPCLS